MAVQKWDHFRDPKRDQQARAQLDQIRRVTENGIETGGDPAFSMDPQYTKLSGLPYEVTIHAGFCKDLNDEMLRVINLANEVAAMDQQTSDLMYEAVAKMAMAVNRLGSPEIKKALAERDAKRATAFSDYWRSHQGKVSRY